SSQLKKVIIIAADLASLNANPRTFKGRKGRLCLREESCLYLSGNFQLLGSVPFRCQPLLMCATLLLDFPSHLVRAQKGKQIPVHVLEASGDRAPRVRLWRRAKAQPAPRPFRDFCAGIDGTDNPLRERDPRP